MTILVHPVENEGAKHLANVNAICIPQALWPASKNASPDELRDAKFPEQHLVSTTNLLMAWRKSSPAENAFPTTSRRRRPSGGRSKKQIDESPEFKVYLAGDTVSREEPFGSIKKR